MKIDMHEDFKKVVAYVLNSMKTKTPKLNVNQWHLLRELWDGQYIQIKKLSNFDWRWRVRDGNHEVVATSGSETYTRRNALIERTDSLFPDMTSPVEVATFANKLGRQPYAIVVAKQKPAKSK